MVIIRWILAFTLLSTEIIDDDGSVLDGTGSKVVIDVQV
jgi:hypothetical protein